MNKKIRIAIKKAFGWYKLQQLKLVSKLHANKDPECRPTGLFGTMPQEP